MVGVLPAAEVTTMTEHIICFSSGTRYNVTPDCPQCDAVAKEQERDDGPVSGHEHRLSIVRAQCLCTDPKAVDASTERDSLLPMIQQKVWPLMRATLARAGCV